MNEPSSFMQSNKSKEWVCYKYNMQKNNKNKKKYLKNIYASNSILTSAHRVRTERYVQFNEPTL